MLDKLLKFTLLHFNLYNSPLHLCSIPYIVTIHCNISKTPQTDWDDAEQPLATECMKVKVQISLLKLPWKIANISGCLLGYFSPWNQNEYNSDILQPGKILTLWYQFSFSARNEPILILPGFQYRFGCSISNMDPFLIITIPQVPDSSQFRSCRDFLP